jgi:hypothetical protein
MEAGALGGLGAKQMMAQTGKLRSEYSNQLAGIEDQINRMYMDTMAGQEKNLLPQAGNMLESASRIQPQVQYIPGTPDSNPMASALSQGAGLMGGMSSLGSMFKGGGASALSGTGNMSSNSGSFRSQTGQGSQPFVGGVSSGLQPMNSGVGFGSGGPSFVGDANLMGRAGFSNSMTGW